MENIGPNQPTESEEQDGRIVAKVNPDSSHQIGSKDTHIRRAKMGSVIIYEISEWELEKIEQGSPSSTYFNFSIFLLSIAVSFTTTLLTVDFPQSKASYFTIFMIVTVVGYTVGVFLMILWLRSKNDIVEVFRRIKDRAKDC